MFSLRKEQLREMGINLGNTICGSPIIEPIFSDITLCQPKHCEHLYYLVAIGSARSLRECLFWPQGRTCDVKALPTAIKTIRINNSDEAAWMATDEHLPKLLPLLTSISTVVISNFDWSTARVALFDALLELLVRARSLEMRNVSGVPMAQFAHYPQLKNLKLDGATPSRGGDFMCFDHFMQDRHKKLHLRSLTIINCVAAMKELVFCLSNSKSRLDLDHLDILEIGCSNSDDMALVWSKFSSFSKAIKCLKIAHILPGRDDDKNDRPLKTLNLSQFPNLTSLVIAVDYQYILDTDYGHNPLPDLIVLLHAAKQLQRPRIEQLSLDLNLLRITPHVTVDDTEQLMEVDGRVAELSTAPLWNRLVQVLADSISIKSLSIALDVGHEVWLVRFRDGLRRDCNGLRKLEEKGIIVTIGQRIRP